MSRTCSACGYDAGFDVAICPACGVLAGGGAPGTASWEKTVVAPSEGGGKPRPRFDRTSEYYESLDETSAGLVARSPEQEETVAANAASVATSASGWGDATIVDRPNASSPRVQDDATVILSAGRPANDGPLAFLVERNGPRAGRVHRLGRETLLGRANEADLVLTSDAVSKRHATVKLEGERFVLWDLASTNHSYLIGSEGTRTRILEPHPLSDGDSVELGDVRLTFISIPDVPAA